MKIANGSRRTTFVGVIWEQKADRIHLCLSASECFLYFFHWTTSIWSSFFLLSYSHEYTRHTWHHLQKKPKKQQVSLFYLARWAKTPAWSSSLSIRALLFPEWTLAMEVSLVTIELTISSVSYTTWEKDIWEASAQTTEKIIKRGTCMPLFNYSSSSKSFPPYRSCPLIGYFVLFRFTHKISQRVLRVGH